MAAENNLGKDKVSRLVWRIAIPSMLGQFVSVLYSIVDRMYIGNIPEIGDVALMDRVAELVGKENIFVKIHPRNRENRFEQAGYATNRDTAMPWELIVLNSSFERTLFMTVGSSAATNPYTIFGIPAKVVFLCELVEDKSKLRNGVLDQTKKVCRDRPDLFFFPKTWEEAEALIPRLLKENRG